MGGSNVKVEMGEGQPENRRERGGGRRGHGKVRLSRQGEGGDKGRLPDR